VRNTQKTKTNLMVFIRPRVLRTAEQAAIETNSKYNYLRDMQQNRNDGKVRMMPGSTQPMLPPLVGPTQPTPPPPPPAPLEMATPSSDGPPSPTPEPAEPAQSPPE
jgi:general secretion pathway protein D